MKKLNEKKGFTLAELLVVVAIIAVLVAVSIPIFTSQLEKARESTDLANLRAAKAAATTALLSEDKTDTVYTTLVGDGTPAGTAVYYDAQNGKLVTSNTGLKPYGKGTASGAYTDAVAPSSTTDTTSVIKVTYEKKGTDTEKKLYIAFANDTTPGDKPYSAVIGG